jgi:hypothetical protein
MKKNRIEPNESDTVTVELVRDGEGPAGASRAHAVARVAEARRRAFGQMTSVVIAVVAITGYIHYAHRAEAPPAPAVEVKLDGPALATNAEPADTTAASEVPEAPAKPPAPPVAPPAPPEINKAALAVAEGELDAASRDRARADARAADAAHRLALTSAQAALDASRARKLGSLVRDPSTRFVQAKSRGGFLRGERDKLEKEVTTLRQLPRPKSTSILSKSPVAKPAASSEAHFELKRNRISYIDLDRLLDLTKADAQIRIRMSDRVPSISNKVGPVGSFSLEYELLRSVPGSMEELIERKSLRYDLRAWEVVPEFESRGETYEATKNPISEFSRAINRINPARVTITLWVYPDSFTLYRRMRNELVERGFSVAARPLPDGMTIRGSPLGTQSAAQ